MTNTEQILFAIFALCGATLAYMIGYGLATHYDNMPKEKTQLSRSVLLSGIIFLLGSALIISILSLSIIISHLTKALF